MKIEYSIDEGWYDDLGRLYPDGTFEILATTKKDVKKLIKMLRKEPKAKDFLRFVLDTKFPNGVWSG